MFNYNLIAIDRMEELKEFQIFLEKRGTKLENDITKEDIRDYIIEKRGQPGDISNTINIINDYFNSAQNDFLAFETGSHLDSIWHYQRLSELIKSELGEEVWRQVFDNVQMPEIGWTLDEFADFTRQMYEKLSKAVPKEQIEKMVQKHAHGSQFQPDKEIEEILKSKGVDGLIEHFNSSTIKEAEECRDKGVLWWSNEVDDNLIDFLKKNPQFSRNGNKIIHRKGLPLPEKFYAETDEKLIRYLSCHCSLKRQSILQDEGGLSHSLCHCCLAHDMEPFIVAFGREFTGRVVHSVMDEGCFECLFEIDIPNGFIK